MHNRTELRARLYHLAIQGLWLINEPINPWIVWDIQLMAWEAREVRKVLWTWLD